MFPGDAFEVGVVELVKLRPDGDAALQREALDQAAHFSVTCDGDGHSNTLGSSSEKNSVWSDSTAWRRSFSATTKLRFNSEAPCEIMRMFMSVRESNARAATPGVYRMFSPTRQTMA